MLRFSRILAGGYLALALLLTAITVALGPLGSAPFPLPISIAREPIVVRVAYSTEKKAWLEEAARRFNAEGRRSGTRPIQIELEGIGSQEMVTQIVQGQLQPVVVSPASAVQIEALNSAWQARNGAALMLDGADAPQPLVLTPLVLVAWQERGQVLWPNNAPATWPELHDAVADPQGWAARGHPEWGTVVKFAHTSPQTSNSGLQTLLLLAYAYHNKGRDLSVQDVRDPNFVQWLSRIEQGVPSDVPDSTGTLMTDMLRYGPSKYDVVAVYENLAIESLATAQGRGGAIRLYYPPATALSDHPYAVLNAPWVTAEQRAAAAIFRDYLLSQPIQELALQYGFRPANPQVTISADSPANPFVKFRNANVQVDIQQQVALPSADVLNALVDVWAQAQQR